MELYTEYWDLLFFYLNQQRIKLQQLNPTTMSNRQHIFGKDRIESFFVFLFFIFRDQLYLLKLNSQRPWPRIEKHVQSLEVKKINVFLPFGGCLFSALLFYTATNWRLMPLLVCNCTNLYLQLLASAKYLNFFNISPFISSGT